MADKSRVTEIRFEKGVSFERDGTWYKLAYSETRLLAEGADVQHERKNLYEQVSDGLEIALTDILGPAE